MGRGPATYKINRLPSSVLDIKTPIELLAQFYPYVRTFNGLSPKIFGHTSFVYVHSQNREKLDPCAIKCTFIGYSLPKRDINVTTISQSNFT